MIAEDLLPPGSFLNPKGRRPGRGGMLLHWRMMAARVPGVVVVRVAWMMTCRGSWR